MHVWARGETKNKRRHRRPISRVLNIRARPQGRTRLRLRFQYSSEHRRVSCGNLCALHILKRFPLYPRERSCLQATPETSRSPGPIWLPSQLLRVTLISQLMNLFFIVLVIEQTAATRVRCHWQRTGFCWALPVLETYLPLFPSSNLHRKIARWVFPVSLHSTCQENQIFGKNCVINQGSGMGFRFKERLICWFAWIFISSSSRICNNVSPRQGVSSQSHLVSTDF